MASPEELQLEQKARALKLKEDALNRQAQTQTSTEKRLSAHQEKVAQTERANRLKAQELVKREQKLEDEQRLLEQESESLSLRHTKMAERKRNVSLVLLPTCLIICIVGGYLTFDFMTQQKIQHHQIALASKNIDKLANILNMTQEQVIHKSSTLQNKKIELDKTKTMLVDLKSTSDQLQTEIIKLKDDQHTSSVEKDALSSSAETLISQLSALNAQLEDNYLTIDINEALIDYQEHDIKVFKDALADHQQKLKQKEEHLNEQHAKHTLLNELLSSSKQQNKALSAQLREMNTSLKTIQKQLKDAANENKQLLKQNASLSSQTGR